MNKAYIIAYTGLTPGHDSSALKDAIQRSPKFWHYIKTIWIVSTAETPTQLWTRLAPHVGKLDYLLIIEAKSSYYGWLPAEAWDWIKMNVPRG
jgi:hypothetical protein